MVIKDEYDWLGKDNQLGIDIWRNKYQYENETFNEWLDRISSKNNELRQLILEKKFLFGGRILSNRGLQDKGKKITYSNCFVIEPPEDNIESIFECAKKMARTFSMGGGCGTDISKLAPRGSKLNNAAKETTGAVSFMDLYSLVTELISQNGRRGALLLSIDCTHPDLLEFIDIKNDLNKITKANISIKITDKFMNAVKNNEDWELKYTRSETGEVISKIVNAKKLFNKIAENNWNIAEPGFLMWDTINNWNLLSEDENFKYAGVNPCAEEPLPSGGSCLLGSINLSEFVDSPFTLNTKFNFNDFKKAVSVATMALNDILDEGIDFLPLQEQTNSVRDWRQIGLGIFGLADMLIKLGLRYGSEESLKLCDEIGTCMIIEALKTSAILAKEKGTYPKYDKEAITSSQFFIDNTDDDTKKIIFNYGLRNSQLLTCAPTGSLSTMLGVSGGIEPIYNYSYKRKTESLHNKDMYYTIYTPIVKEYMNIYNLDNENQLPDYFTNAMLLNYKDRIKMQSIWQYHIDASISSTINLPNETTIEEIEDIYMLAWENKLKGITIYRDGCKRSGILNNIKDNKFEEKKSINCKDNCPLQYNLLYDSIAPIEKDTFSETYGSNVKKKVACGNLYINLCKDTEGNMVEAFINTSKGGICQSNTNAISRLISLALRCGIRVEDIVDTIGNIKCPACTALKVKGEKIESSCPDAIAKYMLEKYNQGNVIIKEQKNKSKKRRKIIVDYDENKCPNCGEPTRFEGGCIQCVCGWSKCN